MICQVVLATVGFPYQRYAVSTGTRYDDHRTMPLRGDSLGKHAAANCHARVLVPGLPVYRCGQRNGQRLLSHCGLHGDRKDERLSKCRRQWQRNAPAILSVVRDTALQRGRGAAASDLRASRHFRRSSSRRACDDNLDVVRAPLGPDRRRIAAGGEATTSGGMMNYA